MFIGMVARISQPWWSDISQPQALLKIDEWVDV